VGTIRSDDIRTFAGDDDIFAGDGNDFIRPGEGNDEVFGGSGNDTVIFSAQLNQSVINRNGYDLTGLF